MAAFRKVYSLNNCLIFVIVCFSYSYSANVQLRTEKCEAVKYAYGSQEGFNRWDVPATKIEGTHLQICSRGMTCCTKEMEEKLSSHSKTEFNKMLDDQIGLLQTTFISRTAKFDTFFTELLDNSKADLNQMFIRTYGILYEQNSDIFMDLFKDLRDYYKGKDMNLLDVLDKFFSDLLEKMFVLLHTQYEFSDSYLECMTGKMDELRPFGDVPGKMSSQVKRSFIAARTFVQGLAVGRDVVVAVNEIEMTSSCRKAITKMRYCPYCSGFPYNKPCNNYCMNVMKGCLANYADLNKDWNIYLDALRSLAERLGGPFNIEAVVDPIDVKISDAIMNFQEGSDTITQKVFQGCSRPPYQRSKREAASSYDDFTSGWKYERKNYNVRPTTAAGTSLDRLVRDIEEQVSTTRDYFKNLPNVICTDLAMPIFEDDNCWNGQSVDRYLPDVQQDGTQNQINNPEVDVDIRKSNFIINRQILQLKLITNKLRNAHSGVDVDWIDIDDHIEDAGGSGRQLDGSGSGSGYGGSGYGEDEAGYRFDDDYDRNDFTIAPRGPDGGRFPVYNQNPKENVDIEYSYEGSDFEFDSEGEASSALSVLRHQSVLTQTVTSLFVVLLLTFVPTSFKWWT